MIAKSPYYIAYLFDGLASLLVVLNSGLCFCSLQHPVTCYPLGLVYLVQQGQPTTQGLTYVTVDYSWRRPINVPNENLDVQYTGVKFDTEAPAV